MQFTTILASTLIAFASGITALPAPAAQITLRIFNDQTGVNAAATVPADNVPRYVSDLFRDTPIGKNGLVATSAQLVQFSDTSKCSLINRAVGNGGSWEIKLDGRAKNFVDLDGDVTKAVPVYIGGFSFQCSQA
ncbi:hypothetical protein FB567DRAFT_242252 [Paraphoma chrysanthemicola]|uniref:Uncharacterized protein n=1 Tax=Paraphoma chrysanthemicola TaxID=798071 RepID=A0A8K0W330_9PLEO|nr:hypothetical protein FB567DRAFT_242252 [Paraphoma chrysanthemicola]